MSERVLSERAEASFRKGARLPGPAGFASHLEEYVLDDVARRDLALVDRRRLMGTESVFLSAGSDERHQVSYMRVATLDHVLDHGQHYRPYRPDCPADVCGRAPRNVRICRGLYAERPLATSSAMASGALVFGPWPTELTRQESAFSKAKIG